MEFAVYIITNPNRAVLYTGTTNNLPRRLVEHYLERGKSATFTGKNYCYNLVFYDVFPTMMEAIEAEKRIKGKSRTWKDELVSEFNPDWKFLNKVVVGEWPPNKMLEDPYFQNYIRKFDKVTPRNRGVCPNKVSSRKGVVQIHSRAFGTKSLPK